MSDPEVSNDGEELGLLVNSVLDYAIFLLSPTGEIRSWNAGATRTMGYTAEEAIGTHFSRFYTEEDLANEKPANELRIAADKGRIEDEGWRVRKGGTHFWANTVITALRGADGALRGFAKITRDLTERRADADALRQPEDRRVRFEGGDSRFRESHARHHRAPRGGGDAPRSARAAGGARGRGGREAPRRGVVPRGAGSESRQRRIPDDALPRAAHADDGD